MHGGGFVKLPKELHDDLDAALKAAHKKHGAQSIAVLSLDDPAWLSILVEEVGEVAHAMTYDADVGNLQDELIQVATVAAAWAWAIDRDTERDLYDIARAPDPDWDLP
jgi:hypothetical protein